MLDMVALGELLIDFTPAGHSASGSTLFEGNPGGAPANVLVALSMLGGKGAFIGKVGDDQFGHFLKDVLERKGVDARGLRLSREANTTLAFVHLDERGDRSFSFYRNPGADTLLRTQEVDFGLIDSARVFHFGSVSMTHEPARSATLAAVRYAKENGKIVSYDPNWRPLLWESDAAAKEGMLLGLEFADVLKLSDVEMEFLTGEPDPARGSARLLEMGIDLVVVTLGPKGCYYRCRSGAGHLPTYDTKVVDTTGAGDVFMGALLFHISRIHAGGIRARGAHPGEAHTCGTHTCEAHAGGAHVGRISSPIELLEPPEIERILDFSNAAGALCATKRGAIPAMPTMDEVVTCMRNVSKLS